MTPHAILGCRRIPRPPTPLSTPGLSRVKPPPPLFLEECPSSFNRDRICHLVLEQLWFDGASVSFIDSRRRCTYRMKYCDPELMDATLNCCPVSETVNWGRVSFTVHWHAICGSDIRVEVRLSPTPYINSVGFVIELGASCDVIAPERSQLLRRPYTRKLTLYFSNVAGLIHGHLYCAANERVEQIKQRLESDTFRSRCVDEETHKWLAHVEIATSSGEVLQGCCNLYEYEVSDGDTLTVILVRR